MNFLNQVNKYVFFISLILNGILLMFITGIVPFFLYLSLITNVFLVWYSLSCLIKTEDLETDMIVLLQQNESFLDQLENIHSLEMYYGDEHLQNLIDESRNLVNDFIDIQEKYFDVEVLIEEEDTEQVTEEAPEE